MFISDSNFNHNNARIFYTDHPYSEMSISNTEISNNFFNDIVSDAICFKAVQINSLSIKDSFVAYNYANIGSVCLDFSGNILNIKNTQF